MIQFIKFIYSPGGEDGSSIAPDANEEKKDDSPIIPTKEEGEKQDKTIVQKIREALEDWSEKDEEDQEFDDSRV